MNILYISTLISNKNIKVINEKYGIDLSGITIQKFHRLIVNGLVKNNVNLSVISSLPVTEKLFVYLANDKENNVKFHYPIVVNLPVLRHIILFIYTMFISLKWSLKIKGQKIIICDVLNVSVAISSLFCKLFGIRVVGIMTDMPGLMVSKTNKRNYFGGIISMINKFSLKWYNGYIFLTEAMNEVINTQKRPYIIMEGLVDVDMQYKERKCDNNIKNIIYAGGLNERYGIKMLVDAFMKIKNSDLRLSLYGFGPMIDLLKVYEEQDYRVKYYGLRPNAEIVEEELKAFLLVNPRPTVEEFTKYSFPSKNMEYMVSGTPLLTTALPGMPKEYYDKVIICYDESEEGFRCKLEEIINTKDEALWQLGKSAKDFVLKNKNNIKQGEKIKNFVNSLT